MKEFVAGVLFVFVLCSSALDADASWLLDLERVHVSAHGQNSCQDCHEEIVYKALHPDPAEVNKTLPDFYRLEQCTACHEDVLEDAEEGTHGGEKIADNQAFKFCIRCHDPHYQLSYADLADKIDLSQPKDKKCSICHELQKELPELSPEDDQCMGCHRSVDPDDAKATGYISNLCFHCHSKSAETEYPGTFARFDISVYSATIHSDITCITCHLQAVEFQHSTQQLDDCRQCHLPHDVKVAHDAHALVSCQACHLNQVVPVRNAGSGRIGWQIDRQPDDISAVHSMIRSNADKFCRRCHFNANSLGAAAMVLPAKSVICMPCHAATFAVGDTTTILALIILGLGVLGLCSIWFSGSLGGVADSVAGGQFLKTIKSMLAVIFSRRLFSILKILVLDGLLQRRLFRFSSSRWLIHALIFFPFLFRFCWGLIALVSSVWLPGWQGGKMLDKNHPLTTFLFDLSGVLVILGFVLIIARKYILRSEGKLKGLPRADWPAYALIGGIIIFGFILEGMRIAMTGTPQGAPYAFLGYVISLLFAGADLTDIYGYVWYIHAIFTGAFLAYLPFSRMLHMVMAPVVLAINLAGDAHSSK